MLHQIQKAIEPDIPIDKVFHSWNQIAYWMAESNRKRRPQMEAYYQCKLGIG